MRGLYDCIKEDKMSEEKIIQTLENRLKSWNNIKEDCKNSELSNVIDQIEKDNQATQGLLDLYNKQKEEIEELKVITKEYDSYIGEKMPLDSKIIIADRDYFINGTFVDNYISKDKIKHTLLKFQDEYGEDLLFIDKPFIGKEVVQYGEDMLDEIAKELDIKLLEE